MTTITKFFKDKNGKVVVWQTPNIPLISWALFSVLARVVPSGAWQQLTSFVSFGFIFTWAWLEITEGSSYFRRTLGIVVLIVTLSSKFFTH